MFFDEGRLPGTAFARKRGANRKGCLVFSSENGDNLYRSCNETERLVISNPDYLTAREPKLEESLKVVPNEFLPFDHHVSQVIYGHKIAFIDFNQPIATIIENPILADFQRDIFMMLFRTLKRHK